ncbi:hypothetical protein CCM_01044 [Cordyceps militaris CM01]|uniref:Uncharacterized protein n=1 Tax=Cordyceps militaris (strain CM01) TaxID=983644 RepID=G3J2Q4_CORMM|nr:uncharacterized protein CCM_01044 [Cordyceps militaris CM01]EGX96388.1 hypothetical protein CCM_01044 [Cordyceps militaris CM01]
MPPQLDLSDPRLLVIPPRMNLRRAASYNLLAQGQDSASSSSSQLPLSSLLWSPPPSPSLPSLVPRRKRASSNPFSRRPSRIVRFLFYLCALSSLAYLLVRLFGRNVSSLSLLEDEYNMVAQDDLPDFPTPIVIDDNRGRSKWTVSIPRNYRFPLSMETYSEMMGHCREAAIRQTSESASPSQATLKKHGFNRFIDVAEAEKTHLLPSSDILPSKRSRSGNFVGLGGDVDHLPVCQSSMTYVLESTNAGIGHALMSMWTSYGIAKELGKAFFIDDSRWAYGSYTDIFQPPPVPKCQPPLRHHILPCPAEARHLVVSNTNAHEVLPALVATIESNDKITETQRLFNLARAGYLAMFKLNTGDGTYTDKRIHEILTKAQTSATSSGNAPVIGLHIRHGDRHPIEFQYKDTYIPAEVYLSKVRSLIEQHYNQTADTDNNGAHDSITMLASDDPNTYQEDQLSGLLPAQDRIQLASKDNIEDANNDPRVLHHFVEDTFGWEGGFFAPIFWHLGSEAKDNSANAPAATPYLSEYRAVSRLRPSQQTLKLRSLLGRAYMMDLAVLSGASDKVVCAVSAMGCRILGLMMGWDGIQAGTWINVDGDYGWRGLDL